MNRLLSLGTDRGWREEAAREAMLPRRRFVVLDSATGTGDLAFAIYNLASRRGKKVKIIGTDFVKQMLDIAEEKSRKAGIKGIEFRMGNSLRPRSRSGSIDVITTGLSLRNFDDVGRFLRESHRILKKGGRLVVLEMALPDDPLMRAGFRIYSSILMGLAGVLVDGAYFWLLGSINRFDKKALVRKADAAGFRHVRLRPLPLGVAFLLIAEK
ncbi:MAG: class I SAM-dependent methyltransferase [Candidatus Marsarchaeota archaeon]|nr:class I SAM-dependent methyltransferase [Candidatus Marsarchaeota archaeon]